MIYFKTTEVVACSGCPAGFGYTVEGIPKCYAVVTQKLGWDGAQANCRQLHPKAHLVVINSALENQVIQEILKNFDCAGTAVAATGQTFNTNNYWTSGRRTSDSCTSPFIWKASIGQAQSLAYTNWRADEPNCAFNEEFCLSFCAFQESNRQWNDIICSWAVCSVCEVVKYQQWNHNSIIQGDSIMTHWKLALDIGRNNYPYILTTF